MRIYLCLLVLACLSACGLEKFESFLGRDQEYISERVGDGYFSKNSCTEKIVIALQPYMKKISANIGKSFTMKSVVERSQEISQNDFDQAANCKQIKKIADDLLDEQDLMHPETQLDVSVLLSPIEQKKVALGSDVITNRVVASLTLSTLAGYKKNELPLTCRTPVKIECLFMRNMLNHQGCETYNLVIGDQICQFEIEIPQNSSTNKQDNFMIFGTIAFHETDSQITIYKIWQN